METKYQIMPAIQISREALATLKRYHTSDEIANALFAVADYFWTGKDPDGLTDKELDAFETIMEYSKQKADGWLNAHNKRVESAIETNKKKAAKKQQEIEPNHDFENEAPTQPSNIETKPIPEPIQSPERPVNISVLPKVQMPVNEPKKEYEHQCNFIGYLNPTTTTPPTPTNTSIMNDEFGFPQRYVAVIDAHKKDFLKVRDTYGDKDCYEAFIGAQMRQYAMDITYRNQIAQYVNKLSSDNNHNAAV